MLSHVCSMFKAIFNVYTILGDNMENVKKNSFHILLVWFLSYSFFVNKFISNRIMTNFGTKGLFFIILIDLLFPLVLLFYKPLKRIQKEKLMNLVKIKPSIFFVFKLFISVYLILTSIYTLRHICSFLSSYYFDVISLAMEIVLLLLLVLYASYKSFDCLSTISVLIAVYVTVEFVIYIITGVESRWFLVNYIPSFQLSEIIEILLYLSIFIIDFVLLFLHSDDSMEPLKKKHIIFFCFLLACINIFEKVKMVTSLGPLVEMYKFPSFEVWRLSSIDFIRMNVDFIPLIGWIMIAFVRLSLSLHLFDKVWNKSSVKFNVIVLTFIGIVTYIFSSRLSLSSMIDDTHIFMWISGLVSCVLLGLIVHQKKGGLKRVK